MMKKIESKILLRKSIRWSFVAGLAVNIIYLYRLAIHEKWFTGKFNESFPYFIAFGGPILVLFYLIITMIIGTPIIYFILKSINKK